MLRKFFSRFSSLQWKLTLSYTLVTVGVLSIILLSVMVFSLSTLFTLPQLPTIMADALQEMSPDLTPYLENDKPDPAVLHGWLRMAEDPTEDSTSTPFSTQRFGEATTVIVNREGVVLASSKPEKFPEGMDLTQSLPFESAEVLRNALNGVTEGHRIGASQVDTTITAGTPIFTAEKKEVIGALFMQLAPPRQTEVWIMALSSLLPSILVITLFAGLIGTGFGALTARGFTRRLRNITRATNAWGHGDFAPRLNDASGDEIAQLAQNLNHMVEELQAVLRTQQELAALEERNRLARDLHDSVKQQVFAASMNLGAAQALWETKPDDARQRVDAALMLSRQTQTELTSLIQTLRPAALEEKGLLRAVRELSEDWQKQNNVRLSCQVSGDRSLPAQVEQAIFRVVQEALANITRHAAASQVEITLKVENGQVSLIIHDNGAGFNPANPSRGLGLHTMQERVQNAGGHFKVESGSTGTTICAEIPL